MDYTKSVNITEKLSKSHCKNSSNENAKVRKSFQKNLVLKD